MATATGTYITKANFEARVTAAVVVQLFGDSGAAALNSGDEAILTEFILDSESEVEDVVKKVYGNAGLDWLRTKALNAPRTIKRMALDVLEVRAFRRHPEYIRAEWVEREKAIERDLKALLVREIEIATSTTSDDMEPAVRDGGEVRSGDPDNTTPKAKVFLDGMGIF